MKTTFCDNQFCDNEAVKRVAVSVARPADSIRKFCEACFEAYTLGTPHGRLSENPEAFRVNSLAK